MLLQLFLRGAWCLHCTEYKTYIDYENNRTKERSIIQLQVLVDQLTNETSPFLHDRKQIADSAPIWERLMVYAISPT